MFNKKQVAALLIPVFLEQLSVVFIGIVHAIMLSGVSSGAMNAASLVNTFNNVVMYIFIAVSTGIAVKVAQYIGKSCPLDAQNASEQAVLLELLISVFTTLVVLLFGWQIIGFLFGSADSETLENARIYLAMSAISYPFYALYSVCASICRGAGEYKLTLVFGVLLNVLNVAIAAVLIYVYNFGILGAGISLIICRVVCGVLMWLILHRGTHKIRLKKFALRLKKRVIGAILSIGIPAAIDSILTNGGALIVQTFIVGMGSAALAGSVITNSIIGFMFVPGNAIAAACVTIVGQTFGSGDLKLTRRYMWKIIFSSVIVEFIVCAVTLLFMNPIIELYSPSPEAFVVAKRLLTLTLISFGLIWSIALIPPCTLRATGDVKYCTLIGVVSMWTIRVLLAWLLGVKLGLGVDGVWYAMIADIVVRGAFFVPRVISKKWERLDRI